MNCVPAPLPEDVEPELLLIPLEEPPELELAPEVGIDGLLLDPVGAEPVNPRATAALSLGEESPNPWGYVRRWTGGSRRWRRFMLSFRRSTTQRLLFLVTVFKED
jgi:hypothetical protein